MEQAEPSGKQKKSQPNYLWIAIVLGVFIVVMAWREAPQQGIWFGYFIGSAITMTAVWNSNRLAGCLYLAAAGIILTALLIALRPDFPAPANIETKMNLHHVVLNLEQYYDRHQCYPASISELLTDDPAASEAWPVNPFFKEGIKPEPAKWLELQPANAIRPLNEVYQHSWWPREARGIAGNFIYLPETTYISGEPYILSYELIGFGIPEHNSLVARFLPADGVVPLINLSSPERKWGRVH